MFVINNVKSQSGIGLIEVLISMFILSVGVLALTALMIKSIQLNQSALYQSEAQVFANDIVERIRSNRESLVHYQIGLEDSKPKSIDCFGKTKDCSAKDLASHDVYQWREGIEKSLPQGTGAVELDNFGAQDRVIVTIQYVDARIEKGTAYGANNRIPPKQLTFQTFL